MSYAYINRDYTKNKPKFWLCLPYPRRTGMRKLTDIYNVDVKFILGRVHELSFDIPAKIERDHQLIKNPLIDLFQGYYQVKMEWNGQIEYFVYVKGNRKLDNSGKSLSYKLYSTSYLIGKKSIPIYEETSKNLRFHAEHFLLDTNWTIGDIDSDFENTYREITASQSNSLQCLYDLCDKFEAVMVFDTVNQIVHFHKPENIGINKGMTFKDGITLESLGQEIDYDKIITRLHVYGSDGLEFRRLSLTGVNYLQDLSWFIYPFEQDSNGNVIKSSKWLTDGFCKNYFIYQKVLETSQPVFDNLTNNLTIKQDDLVQLQSELSSLQMELNQIENELWVINKTYMEIAPNREDWQNATSRKSNKESEISAKNAEIAIVESDILQLEQEINKLRLSLQLNNFFTPEQIVEMKEFIHTGYYTNDAITEDEDLLEDGKVAFKKVNQPPITIDLGIVNFMNDIEFEKLKDRIVLGDTVKVKSEDLDVYVSLKIIEIAYSNDNINLTISNEKDLRDDMSKLVDEIYSSSHTSTVVDTNKGNWDKGGEANDKVNDILNNPWDSAKNSIFGGYLNTTTLDKHGLKSVDSDNPSTFLFINDGVFSISEDNGETIKVAIDNNGVRARTIYGELILSNEMKIISESGVIEIDGETVRVKDDNGDVKVELGKYIDPSTSNDVYGLNIIGGAFNLRTSTTSNQGTVIDGDGIRVYDSNGNVVFDTSDGDNLQYNGSINLSGDTDVRGKLIFKDNTSGEGSIYYNNGNYK